jgi:hypothetical protein
MGVPVSRKMLMPYLHLPQKIILILILLKEDGLLTSKLDQNKIGKQIKEEQLVNKIINMKIDV